jgi:hypothetical protein
MIGKNVDKTKVEIKVAMENFLNEAFQKFHIAIWSCMRLEDILKVLPMLMPESLLNWFVFIWGCEQCFKTFGEISPRYHYYLNDLKRVYYACYEKNYGKEEQTLLINDEHSKALWNLKCISFFLESFRG